MATHIGGSKYFWSYTPSPKALFDS